MITGVNEFYLNFIGSTFYLSSKNYGHSRLLKRDNRVTNSHNSTFHYLRIRNLEKNISLATKLCFNFVYDVHGHC